jgi:hypothetical protein
VIIQYENARPHAANMMKAVIQKLNCKILSHPTYSPELAPSDYHLFRSLSNNLSGVSFNKGSEFQNWLDDFYTTKPADFFKRRIEILPKRWDAVVNNGGEYIID